MADLTVSVGDVQLKNPVIAASGTFGFGREYAELFDIGCLGGIASKGLTLHPRLGNPAPRIAETPSGMLNAVGLQNPGLKAFLETELPWMREEIARLNNVHILGVLDEPSWLMRGLETRIIANVAGHALEEYEAMAEALNEADIDALELNISCPNVKEGGMAFGVMSESVERVTRAVRAKCQKPLWVKLTPNVADIAENAMAAEAGGADTISLINTLTGMAIDIDTRRPILGNVTGGLSGPCVKPIALHMVYRASKAVSIPVVGMGGIRSGRDIMEFMLAGASAVMVGTAGLADPMAWAEIIDEFERLLGDSGIKAAVELTGGLVI